jgi:hypothetical protein
MIKVDFIFLNFTKFYFKSFLLYVPFPYRVLKAVEGKWITDQLVSLKKYLSKYYLCLRLHVSKLAELKC